MRTINSINLGNLLLSLSDAIDLANSTISQHQQRTAYIAWEICKCANLNNKITRDIFIASLLHDTGAITVEEKISLHNFETTDLKYHCHRGELLLNRITELNTISKIIKHHHTNWNEWEKPFERNQVIASQIVFLADYIERMIDRDKYILHQVKDITEHVNRLSGKIVHPKITGFFLEAAKREEFWFDLSSPRLYSLMFHEGPLTNVWIDYSSLENISTLFRDIIDFKSPFTAAHTSGVSACAEIIAKIFGLNENEIQEIKIAGNFHDLGKLIVPNRILEKPNELTKEEYDIIKSHSYYSYYIINSVSGLKHIAEWAAFHHEKLNGTGYPFKCDKKDMPTCSRIIAVADVFTAISEDRPYRDGMSKDSIIRILKDMAADESLDTKIVTLLIDNYTRIDEYVKTAQESARIFYKRTFNDLWIINADLSDPGVSI